VREFNKLFAKGQSMKYQIKVWGSGGRYGIGSISQEQYDFWIDSDNHEYLADEARQQLDDEIDVPEEARFEDHYSEYVDVGVCSGPDRDFAMLSVTDEDGNEIYKGEYGEFKDIYESDSEYLEINLSDREGGQFLFWINAERGTFYTATIETDTFNPEQLSFKETDIYGEAVLLTNILYANEELELESGNPNSMEEQFILLSNEE
jgi:hypothetical protein